ncbi:HNH endonuclease family protein [Actinoplanes sp. NPDC051475]|uniref:HNH endonuclease family protein n=1 Tax=Actinoplanes sp. NPDC051475 TaxID=3157225 RepID=UPI00344E2EA1
MHRSVTLLIATLATVLSTAGLSSGPAQATPPGIPSKATAQSKLDVLVVAAQGSMSGYSRDLFPHWITVSGSCNTRETVLKRDGASVVTDSACASTSGRWYSPYDGATWTLASDVDIDHVVPLAEAWRSGAGSWITSKRQGFANDLTRPQLIAVTDNVNQAKGDQDPSTWQPGVASYRCTYAKMWIAVKSYWALTLQSSEKTALQGMLDTCAS